MPDFDPYRKWLGIPLHEQPPDHYRLLGIEPYEADPEVIEAATERLVSFLQDVAAGPHAKASQRLLNEVAEARLCLLDAEQKSKYDAWLATELAQRDVTPPPIAEPAPTATSTAAALQAGSARMATAPRTAESDSAQARQQPSLTAMWMTAGACFGSLILVVILVILLAERKKEPTNESPVDAAKMGRRLQRIEKQMEEPASPIPDFQPRFPVTNSQREQAGAGSHK